MCLTIPKKVISVKDNNEVVVEKRDGGRQILKSIIPLTPGDYVLSQQNVIVEKISADEAKTFFNLLSQLEESNDEDK